MQNILHLAALFLGLCIAVASSMPITDGIPWTAEELGSPYLPETYTTQGKLDKQVLAKATILNANTTEDNYTCWGSLKDEKSDCATLANNLHQNAAIIYTDPHKCVGFTQGSCVAKLCSNSDSGVVAAPDWFALRVSELADSCTSKELNGVMAPCSDDSFEGKCAWWQIWLQSI